MAFCGLKHKQRFDTKTRQGITLFCNARRKDLLTFLTFSITSRILLQKKEKLHQIDKLEKQAGAELGQAQLKLELELCYTSSVLIQLEIA